MQNRATAAGPAPVPLSRHADSIPAVRLAARRALLDLTLENRLAGRRYQQATALPAPSGNAGFPQIPCHHDTV